MPKILVVEDDPQLRAMLVQMLTLQHFQVTEAADGESGILAFREFDPDLVISDLIMPLKDGIMMIQELLTEKPNLKIIAMSGGSTGNAAWLPIARRAGAMQIVKKPFGTKELLAKVNETLARPW
jgi:DNA-binding response OmpR family regulator